MNFQWLEQLLALLGSPSNQGLIQKLVTLGIDAEKVAVAVVEKQGVPAIIAAVTQLVKDAEAALASANTPVNPSVG